MRLAVFLVSSLPALACTCSPRQDPSREGLSYPLIFAGHVLLGSGPDGESRPALVEIRDAIRGLDPARKTIVVNGGGVCHNRLFEGREYMIYATPDALNPLEAVIHVCGPTFPLSAGEPSRPARPKRASKRKREVTIIVEPVTSGGSVAAGPHTIRIRGARGEVVAEAWGNISDSSRTLSARVPAGSDLTVEAFHPEPRHRFSALEHQYLARAAAIDKLPPRRWWGSGSVPLTTGGEEIRVRLTMFPHEAPFWFTMENSPQTQTHNARRPVSGDVRQ